MCVRFARGKYVFAPCKQHCTQPGAHPLLTWQMGNGMHKLKLLHTMAQCLHCADVMLSVVKGQICCYH